MLALIPLLPFGGFLVNAFTGKRLPKSISGGIATAVMAISFVIALTQVMALTGMPSENRQIVQVLFNWIHVGDFSLDLSLRLDALSAVMILVITGIGTLIHLYSTSYMHDETDPEFARYFSYLNLFCFFMLMLVLGSNALVMFVGWEGVGLCSYLLIGYYYEKKSASDAAKKAFIVNRVGDFAFILGALLLIVTFNSLDFTTIALAVKKIGILSAYRTAAQDQTGWDNVFETWYAKKKKEREATGDGHGDKAVAIMVKIMQGQKAVPGFSNHQYGLAVDFGTREGTDGPLAYVRSTSWFYLWLDAHADFNTSALTPSGTLVIPAAFAT